MGSSHNNLLHTGAEHYGEDLQLSGGSLKHLSSEENRLETDLAGHAEADNPSHPRTGGKSVKRMQELGLFGSGIDEEDDMPDKENSMRFEWDSGLSVSKDEQQDAKIRLITHARAYSGSPRSDSSSSLANIRLNPAARLEMPRMSSWKAPIVGQLAERVEDPGISNSLDRESKYAPTLGQDTNGIGQTRLAPAKKSPATKSHRKYKRRAPQMNEVWEVATFIAKSSKKGMKDLLQQFGEDTDVEPYKSMQAVELAGECNKRQMARLDQKNAIAQGKVGSNNTNGVNTFNADLKRKRGSNDTDEEDEGMPSKRHCSPRARRTATSSGVTKSVGRIFGLKEASSALKAIKQAVRSDMRFDRDYGAGAQMPGAPTPPNDPLTTDSEQYDTDEEALIDTYETMTVVTDKSGKLVLTFAAQSLARELLGKKYEISDMERAGITKGLMRARINAGQIFQKLVTQVKKSIRGDDANPAAEANRVITAALGIDENGDEVQPTIVAGPNKNSRVDEGDQTEESRDQSEVDIYEEEDGSEVSQHDGHKGASKDGPTHYSSPFKDTARNITTIEYSDEDSSDSSDSSSDSE